MQSFQLENFDAAGLQKRGDVAGVVIGGEGEAAEARPLAVLEGALKLAQLLGGLGCLLPCPGDAFFELQLERGEDLIALFGLLLVLLVIAQPKRCVGADENEHELGKPFADLCRKAFHD
jgi:hypothetical protein